MKTIYVHIGLGKTGSTSLQAFLRLNRRTLARHGVGFPDLPGRSSDGNATPAALSLLTDVPAWVLQLDRRGTAREILFEHFWRELLAGAAESPAFVASSEEFESVPPALFRERSRFDGMPKKIIVYLRRQDRVIESVYGQLVQTNHTTQSLTDFVDRILRRESPEYHAYAYHDFLGKWAAAFSREHVTAIVYQRRSEDFIYRSFIDALGLPFTAEYQVPPAQNETRTHPLALEYLRLCNGLRLTRLMNERTRVLHRRLVAGVCSRMGLQHTRFLLPMHLRVRIMEVFREQNRRTAREYVPTAPPDLFDLEDLPNLARH